MTTAIKRYEILNSLPAYGPMYVPVTPYDEPFYSEGFPVRFYRSDGNSWVANFRPGWKELNAVFDFPEHDKIIVIAGGIVYIMKPDQEKPLSTFGPIYSEVCQAENGSLVFEDGLSLLVFDTTGAFWESERISWDGFQNLIFENNIVSGQSFDPLNSIGEWIDFSLNIKTKEIVGGSYIAFTRQNIHIPRVD